MTLRPGRSERHLTPLLHKGVKSENVKEKFHVESRATNGRQGEILQPQATDLTRFVGTYEFFSSSEPSFEEAVVEIVGGQLTINITGNTQTLMPTTSRQVITSISVVSFQIVGQPDTHVRFFMSGENLMGLYYEERRESEDLVVGIAAPKFQGRLV